MSPSLLIEIVAESLNRIDGDDVKTLRSCVLVNRDWARLAIPLLWRNPFENVGPDQPTRLAKLVEVYLAFLSPDETRLLADHQVHVSPSKTGKTLFDYPSFLQDIDDLILKEAVAAWARPSFGIIERGIMCTTLMKSLIRCARGLKNVRLNFPACTVANCIRNRTSHLMTSEILNKDLLAHQGLESVEIYLGLPTTVFGNTPEHLAKLAHTLSRIVGMQRHLREFSIRGLQSGVDSVLEALQSQANTLKKLELIDCEIYHPTPDTFWKDQFGALVQGRIEEVRFDNCNTYDQWLAKVLVEMMDVREVDDELVVYTKRNACLY